MHKYFMSELIPGTEYAAGSQREDIESILREEGYTPLLLPASSPSIFSRLAAYFKIRQLVKKPGLPGAVFFHFPVRSRALRYFHSLARKKGLRTIAYEIDMEGLRDNDKDLLRQEINLLGKFDVVITQNEIKKQFIQQKTGHKQVIIHEMHDYLGVDCKTRPERVKSTAICFAGNLAKAPFIQLLGNLPGLSFNIYGDTTDIPVAANTHYKGKAGARELPCLLEGSFGLVWDGSSIQSGADEGAYLRYNIPHKMALYLMAGLPLIVWKESAMAAWVQQQQVGIAVSSLYELGQHVEKVTENDYRKFLHNLEAIREKMSEGYYLRTAIRSAEKILA